MRDDIPVVLVLAACGSSMLVDQSEAGGFDDGEATTVDEEKVELR